MGLYSLYSYPSLSFIPGRKLILAVNPSLFRFFFSIRILLSVSKLLLLFFCFFFPVGELFNFLFLFPP